MAQRFFIEDLVADTVILTGQEAHHAASVLRLKVGSEVELFDGRGGKAAGAICRLGRGEVAVSILQRHPALRRTGPVVHLGFAVPKGKRLDWLLEKATELGAASLQAVLFERSVAGTSGLGESKARRWLGHCIAAAKQSGLDFLPQLRPPAPLDEFLAASAGAMALLGDPCGQASLPALLAGRTGDQPIVLLVGPEGGITPAERTGALAHGFVCVRIGQTILRTETAAIALLAATLALCAQESQSAG